jgi:hypothetical protein
MTYIRLTGGRDRGHVKEILFEDAQRMLGNGEALPVDFDEPDPLGFRELSAPAADHPQNTELPALAVNYAVRGAVVSDDLIRKAELKSFQAKKRGSR